LLGDRTLSDARPNMRATAIGETRAKVPATAPGGEAGGTKVVVDVPRSGAAQTGPRPREAPMSDITGTPDGEDELDMIEVVTGRVDEVGNVVVDDLIAALDGTGNVVATDETITVETAEGDIVVEETLSIVGDDGELHAVEEDVTVLEVDDEG
jgi:hypothetical protein